MEAAARGGGTCFSLCTLEMGRRHAGGSDQRVSSLQPSGAPQPNTYEDPRCQETNSPYERIFSFFPQL